MTSSALPRAAVAGASQGFEQRLLRLERVLCSLSLAVMLLAVAVGVAIRFFNLPLPNVGEWAVVAMSPLTFVGAALCTGLQEHIAVDLVKMVRHHLVARLLRGTVALALLVFAGVYAWAGWMFLRESLDTGERMLDMGTPVALPVSFVLLGMVLMVVHAGLALWRVLHDRPPLAGAASGAEGVAR